MNQGGLLQIVSSLSTPPNPTATPLQSDSKLWGRQTASVSLTYPYYLVDHIDLSLLSFLPSLVSLPQPTPPICTLWEPTGCSSEGSSKLTVDLHFSASAPPDATAQLCNLSPAATSPSHLSVSRGWLESSPEKFFPHTHCFISAPNCNRHSPGTCRPL